MTSDHGGEVLSNEFQTWLKRRGIYHITAPRRQPNYNSIIERSSAVVENMGFAMLKHAGKPKSWWNVAFDYATYVLDRCPRRSNPDNKTPFEAFHKQKPDLSDLRVFGCISYAHVLPEDHKHLEPRAMRGTFVGFDERRRGVRIILDGQRKYTVHRTAVYHEHSLLSAMKIKTDGRISEALNIPTSTVEPSFSEVSHNQLQSTEPSQLNKHSELEKLHNLSLIHI